MRLSADVMRAIDTHLIKGNLHTLRCGAWGPFTATKFQWISKICQHFAYAVW